MSDILEGLVGAVIGAGALVASGLFVENYKYHRDRRATASAIAGEIIAILDMISRRNHVEYFKNIKTAIEAGKDVHIPDIVGDGLGGKLDPVIEANLTNLGLLTGKQRPERIAKFYTNLRGIRIDIINLAKGAFDRNLVSKANLIGEDLTIWAETKKSGYELSAELRQIANSTYWWPISIFSDSHL